ncbi:hypothetical protein RDABS01_021580 [Bienertia sinuspersici]
MMFKVDFKINKPLKRFIRVVVPRGSKLVKFTYEHIMDIFHACGYFGQTFQQCEKYGDNIAMFEFPYDNCVRASPTRKRNLVNNKEENRTCQEFKGTLKASKEKMKLDFPSSPLKSTKANEEEQSDIDARSSKRGRREAIAKRKDGPIFNTNFDTTMLENFDLAKDNHNNHTGFSKGMDSNSEGAGIHNALYS